MSFNSSIDLQVSCVFAWVSTMTTLDEVLTGQSALVLALHPNVQLAARGVVPGAKVRVLRRGNPMVFCLDDARWAISRDDARAIEVAADAE